MSIPGVIWRALTGRCEPEIEQLKTEQLELRGRIEKVEQKVDAWNSAWDSLGKDFNAR